MGRKLILILAHTKSVRIVLYSSLCSLPLRTLRTLRTLRFNHSKATGIDIKYQTLDKQLLSQLSQISSTKMFCKEKR